MMQIDDVNYDANKTKFGKIAVIGRVNAGKSTLINHMIGWKVCSISDKPHTTIENMIAIKTVKNVQMAFLDTPGIQITRHTIKNRKLKQLLLSSLEEADVVLFILDFMKWGIEEDYLAEKIFPNTTIILVINKIDKIRKKAELLPFIDDIKNKANFDEIVPISAIKKIQVKSIIKLISKYLNYGQFQYPINISLTSSYECLISEIIREKLMQSLAQELPYSFQVKIDRLKVNKEKIIVRALISVKKNSHKAIIVGKNGCFIKKIGEQSRLEIERRFNKKVFVSLLVSLLNHHEGL